MERGLSPKAAAWTDSRPPIDNIHHSLQLLGCWGSNNSLVGRLLSSWIGQMTLLFNIL